LREHGFLPLLKKYFENKELQTTDLQNLSLFANQQIKSRSDNNKKTMTLGQNK
jgi:hypothetical protein